jgi:hypothetical protein
VATIAQPAPFPPPQRRSDAARDSRFFAALAAALVVITTAAFSTTYLIPVATGRFTGAAILHLHGVLFLAWPVLLLIQALSSGRSRRWHRGLGFSGIALASAMVLSGLLAIGSSIETWAARGVGLAGQAISIVAFTGLMLFAVFFVAAVSATRDRATHSRWMLLATFAIMQGATGRLGLLLLTGGNPDMLRPGLLPPPPSMLPIAGVHLLADAVFLAVLALYDRRSLGKVHRATLLGGAALVIVHSTRHLFVETEAWAVIAVWLTAL